MLRSLARLLATAGAVAATVAALGACDPAPETPWPDSGPGPGGDAAADGASSAAFQRCTGRPYTLAPDEGWRHDILTPITTAAGAPNHSGKDAFAHPGAAGALRGKFTYGAVSKDLEDEDVLVSIDDCQGWVALGRFTTDDDGRITAPAPALATGVYEVRYQVAGDQSTTVSYLWVLPAGTRVVVSDIDATLTTSDSEVFWQIFDGSYVPETYPNAVALTKAHEARGHVVMYLTGRPYWLSPQTRGYLAARGFAVGPLRVADSNGDILPTEGSVGDYKRASLGELTAAGLVIDYAYGNATTDIYAYLGAGVPADRVWIIGSNAGEQGTHPVTGDWAARVTEVNALPPVDQPFRW